MFNIEKPVSYKNIGTVQVLATQKPIASPEAQWAYNRVPTVPKTRDSPQLKIGFFFVAKNNLLFYVLNIY
jgi:hypothetical protein